MELSIVIGAYQFIGFHLCKYLLELGDEVLGVDWLEDTAPGNMMEEKQLEIGRNSNFQFKPLDGLQDFKLSNKATIYVSWYDAVKGSTGKRDHLNRRIQEIIRTFFAFDPQERPRIVLLYPLGIKGEEILQDNQKADKVIFLPTIYGPWQHESMAFEQGVRNRGEAEIKAALEKEYRLDAIYITDLLDYFVDILDTSEKNIVVISSKKNQWSMAARVLFGDSITNGDVPEKMVIKDEADHAYHLNNAVAPEQGINLQRQHYKRLKLLGKWKIR
ncbi:hypothetical protein ELQ35_06635 [Peribacillus cavernae]|uniref:NAD(P)-dependent oxidoreductase n=1 Tax=Peribacillus cavernae TaxID=1674310 RepID=A0A3S0U4S0_9BACI|nr:hypothetical protein [Peribacillus cavernae]MDQ0217537.1 nucleoside-diphosphate-sugar epimerase [Peribacillus cavernae]RUQ30027.1 hypothetical protein ELQ35_06635 [Peribacillus cavernae]